MPTESPLIDQEQAILANLLRDTREGRIRWGLQPPSTIQANRGKVHYVLRVRHGRRTEYQLTSRPDGSRDVGFVIRRGGPNAGELAEIYRLATETD